MPARRLRTQRGVVFPSPVVILSVVAVAMAGIAFLLTQGSSTPERDISVAPTGQSTSSSPTGTSSGSPSAGKPTGAASTAAGASTPASQPSKTPTPTVDRATTPVIVFNNSRVTGLAAQVAAQAGQIGWQVVGADNWYGTIPTSTVYYPDAMQPAAKKLALDLGITRTAPAVDPMRSDRLTVILTGPLA